ncbi:hypothetical protein DUNSADRAFT_17209 [Dunaliella salina]|uniref:PhoD-like phosphatase domain-containing protein n=1 Tax=Dunaliella salina TaxID=3046 RepID=A0ABQ7G271_DUNSA|nr:hypothetical protein DUNSADRAFT_17209 [Dunaliella salina]|eukprot:KAF5828696.1 hypothetical protein DUNSADRAFT_17209 [Dunaliella salina]
MGGHVSTPLQPDKMISKLAKTNPAAGPFLRFAGYDPNKETENYRVSCLYVRYEGHVGGAPDRGKQPAPKAMQNGDAAAAMQNGNGAAIQNGNGAAHVEVNCTNGAESKDNLPVLSYGEAQTKVKPLLLDEWKGWHFYRFDLALTCQEVEHKVTYSVEDPSMKASTREHCFYVPPACGDWHWAYYSCNGFHEPEPAVQYKGVQPLWRDLMARHQQQPLQLGVGGGDQLYNDDLWRCPSLKRWCAFKDRQERNKQPFSQEMINEVNDCYLALYLQHWMQPVFRDALASIPQGCYKTARKFYALFQLHTTPERAAEDGMFGAADGWCQLTCLGPKHALLLPDMRSERTQEQIVSADTWKMIAERVMALPEGVEHLIVSSAVPFIFPEVPTAIPVARCFNKLGLECFSCMTVVRESKLDPGIFNAFGTVDLLDDLLDSWNADVHQEERKSTIEMFQRLAEARRLRVSILAGMMVHVTSSAIGNAPPPDVLIDLLNKAAKRSNFNEDTVQDYYQLSDDSDDKIRGLRNWCEITSSMGEPGGQGSSVTFELRFEVVKDGIVNAKPKITTYTVKALPLRPKQSLTCQQEVNAEQITPELTSQEA